MTKNKLLGISLALVMLCGSVPLGFSEPLQVQLEQGIETEKLQCSNDFHVLVQRTNGKLVCVTEKGAEKMNWEIIGTINKVEHIEDGLDNNPYSVIEVITDKITPNFITATPSSENNQSEIDKLGNIIGMSDFVGAELPVYSMTYPDTAKLNEEFEVVINYSFVTYDEGDEDPDELCLGCETKLRLGYTDNVIINDDKFIQSKTTFEPELILPRLTYYHGIIYLEPSSETLEELVPQQQKIKMTIHQRDIDFRIGTISFQFIYSAYDALSLHYVINSDGKIDLSHESITVPKKSTSGSSSASIAPDKQSLPKNTLEISDDWDAYHYAEIPEEFAFAYDKDGNVKEHTIEEPVEQSLTLEKDSAYIPDLADFIRKYYSDVNVREFLKENSATKAFIKKFFELNPDLNKQSFLPSTFSFLPSAYAAAPTFTSVRGVLLVDDINDVRGPATNAQVCAYDHELVNGEFVNTPVKNGQTHVCDETDSTGFFKLDMPTDDPVGSGNVDLFLIATSTGSIVRVTDLNTEHSQSSPGDSRTITAGLYNYGDFNLSSTSKSSKAFETINIVSSIITWYKDTLGHVVGKVNVAFPIDRCTNGAGYMPSSGWLQVGDSNYYDESENREEFCAWDMNPSVENPDSIAHELGHKYFISIYNSKESAYPDGAPRAHGDPPLEVQPMHSPVHAGPSGLAWTEGFAHFMAVAYNGNNGVYQPSYMQGHWNFETRQNTDTTTDYFKNKLFVNGIEGEGNTAAILYDMIDTRNERGDNLSQLLPKIAITLGDSLETGETVIATDLLAFKDDWDDNNYVNLDSVFNHNTIAVTTTPSCIPEVSNGFVFYDHFTCDLANWTESGGNEMWDVKEPDERQRTGMDDNTVANAADCDTDCNLTMTSPISLLGKDSASIEFWRYIDSSLDFRNGVDEGLRLEVSTDGTNWTELGKWTKGNGKANDTWTKETVSLNGYLQNNVKLRFIALASSSSEEIEIDDILIRASDDDGGNNNPNGDNDGDGIANSVDTGVNTFSDSTTSGEITARGGQTFRIIDASESADGVTISTQSTAGDNTISSTTLCGDKATLTMNNGDSVTATCGSVILEAHGTSFGVILKSNNDGDFSTRIQNNDKITFDESVPSISSTSTSNNLTITHNGETLILESGKTLNLSDKVPPTITLNSPEQNPQIVFIWNDYVELNASATDNVDSSPSISIDSNVNSDELGIYQIIYTATDSAGNTSQITREVHVMHTEPIINVGYTVDDSQNINSMYIDYFGVTSSDITKNQMFVNVNLIDIDVIIQSETKINKRLNISLDDLENHDQIFLTSSLPDDIKINDYDPNDNFYIYDYPNPPVPKAFNYMGLAMGQQSGNIDSLYVVFYNIPKNDNAITILSLDGQIIWQQTDKFDTVSDLYYEISLDELNLVEGNYRLKTFVDGCKDNSTIPYCKTITNFSYPVHNTKYADSKSGSKKSMELILMNAP